MTWLSKHPWWPDALLLKLGVITRTEATRRGVPHIKAGTKEQTELDLFQTWALWRAKGGLPPRPGILKGWKPEHEYWTALAAYIKKHKLPPAPPPQPEHANNPPCRWKNAPWCLKHVYASHGMRDQDGTWTPAQLIDQCVKYGTKAVSPQLGSDNPDPDWARHARELYQAGHARGVKVFGWGRADYAPWETVKADIRSVMPLDGYLADVEQRCQDEQLPEHLFAEFGDEMPLGVIATGGIDDSFGTGAIDAAIRWGDNFDFVSQAYHKDTLPLTPDSMENFVWWRSTDKNNGKGFRHLPDANGRWQVPVGMSNAEGTPPMAAQVAAFKPYAPAIGWWPAEIIEASGEWVTWASL